MDSCSYFKLIGCFILISIATAQETQEASCHPHNCKEVYERGNVNSGVYTVKPDELPAFEVYCDMSNGGGWTVFQRRVDGKIDFFLNWVDYVKGFGDLNGEFWLGLSKINRLTAAQSNSLRVDLEDFDGNKKYATYSTFKVGNGGTRYKLTVSGYGGDAGDSLSYHNGMKFSTKDYQNDGTAGPPANCAVSFEGAWWYNNCLQSNLNAVYSIRSPSPSSIFMMWYPHYDLKISEMKFRPS
ncbi:PREDICTED: ficolin-1-like [Amphimedon queenslandica]|uniref:Fibrinogen C-terminal domain-containing protein n=1 Tax=Amphimedon queenslandica TaxID=400682 RepID=A0A1X7T854_AMPQE|nr:PREDICTED: ficolin-1-like [Amphimedon queenslandica]|eukprot:XP_019860948.1 PREDICTED: ficolin-1-like [Amphimedon queenslandica]